ncbi:alpha/beta hydrolase [Mycolicibacterium sp. GF69]|uniref:alpha/beta fold hydrolase n=1 Tax=Mycolicibacterium sp. GF69 TaxID=2267251 RepID=UPI000DCD6873|nr:alpha/beta fold hydrolase [Mycolicibacterium sp. GF69]RAV08939.1 alpha/beta hydrolase [Mycolicibacterium sp. GF69]
MSVTDRFCLLGTGNRVCYRTSGDPTGQLLILIAGLTLDLTSWPMAMVDGLVDRGFYVIRLDNRDVGRSTWATTKPPGLLRQLLGRPRRDGYDLDDMAADTVGLLDHLGVERAHIVGMSMGGMIAQTVAARYPDRVASLTSIFSTTGAARVGQPALSTRRLFARPAARTREQFIARHVDLMRHIAGLGFPLDEAAAVDYAAGAWERGPGPIAGSGVARQINAILKSGDRTEELRNVTAPTAVINGDHDLIVHPSGGRATAAAIPGAHHVTIAGMGHDIAAGVVDRIVDLIARTAHRRTLAEVGRS